MSELPAPLTPPDCDLRDFQYLPIDIARLFGSEFHAQATDSEWRSGFTLWLRSFHQVPAASLPADDIALARLAEFGRDAKAWKKVKAGALRGWTLCADGRLYHRVVAEKALEAWVSKLLQRKASLAGNAKRYGAAFDPAPFDHAVRDTLARLELLNSGSRALAKRFIRSDTKSADGGEKQPAPEGGDLPPGGNKSPTGKENISHREADCLPPGDNNAPTGSEKASPQDPAGTPTGTPGGLPSGSQEKREGERGRIYPHSPPIGGQAGKGHPVGSLRSLVGGLPPQNREGRRPQILRQGDAQRAGYAR